MASKLFSLAFLCIFAVGAFGFSINTKAVHNYAETFLTQLVRDNVKRGSPRIDYGPGIVDTILEVLQGLPQSLLLVPDTGAVNLTALSLALLNSTLLKGEATFWNVTVDSLPDTQIPVCSIVMNGIVQPLVVEVQATNPSVRLHGTYKTDALLSGLIPVRGQGNFSWKINLTADVAAKVKLLGSPLTMTDFAYAVGDLENLDIDIDGLLGGGELNQVVIDIVKTYIPIIEKNVHATLVDTVKEVFLALDLTLNDLLDLLNPTTTTLATPAPATSNLGLKSELHHKKSFDMN